MGKKILVVDDEKDWSKMICLRLHNEGYKLDTAMDTYQAVTQTIKLEPDLVLLDIMMPAGGGFEALKNIRNNSKVLATPVIIVTAKGDKASKDTAEQLGISGYFTKPVDMDALLAKIKEVLGETKEQAA